MCRRLRFCSIADAFVRMYFMDMACKIQVAPLSRLPPPPPTHAYPGLPRRSCASSCSQLDAQAAGGHAGMRMIDASVLKDMDAVSERLQQRSVRVKPSASRCALRRVQVVAKSTVGMGIGAL